MKSTDRTGPILDNGRGNRKNWKEGKVIHKDADTYVAKTPEASLQKNCKKNQ